MQLSVRLGFLLLALLASGPVFASSPAGNAVSVVQQAKGDLNGASTVINVGDGIFMGQKLITGSAGNVQVVFNDNTHLVVGPGSTLVISEYLIRNNGSASKFVVDAVSGTFRFITGNSPKNAYQINTPTGTLGVRGTAFDFGIDENSHETRVLLYHGGVKMCGEDGCVMLTEACSVGLIPQHAHAAVIRRGDQRRPPKLTNFPYLVSQQPLRDDFQIGGQNKCKGPEAAEPTGPAPVEIIPAAIVVPAVKEDDPCPPGHHEHHHYHHGEWGQHEYPGEGGDDDEEAWSPQTQTTPGTEGGPDGHRHPHGQSGMPGFSSLSPETVSPFGNGGPPQQHSETAPGPFGGSGSAQSESGGGGGDESNGDGGGHHHGHH